MYFAACWKKSILKMCLKIIRRVTSLASELTAWLWQNNQCPQDGGIYQFKPHCLTERLKADRNKEEEHGRLWQHEELTTFIGFHFTWTKFKSCCLSGSQRDLSLVVVLGEWRVIFAGSSDPLLVRWGSGVDWHLALAEWVKSDHIKWPKR